MAEFDLIQRYFSQQKLNRKDVLIGIGDDCALLNVPENRQLVVTTDTLVSGIHFDHHIDARRLGHKALAVNLSDLAAMGAEPAWFSLAMTLPEVDESWLDEFCGGLFELAEYFGIQLIGGDTTQGPLSISITAHGLVQPGKAMQRSTARNGDWLFVSGDLGGAAMALQAQRQQLQLAPEVQTELDSRLFQPMPRVLLGQALKHIASACVDVSDGLIADLGHILTASGCGARIELTSLPLAPHLLDLCDESTALQMALSGGDDYELCFTVPEEKRGMMETALTHAGVSFTCIGQLTPNHEIIQFTREQQPVEWLPQAHGFEHFSEEQHD